MGAEEVAETNANATCSRSSLPAVEDPPLQQLRSAPLKHSLPPLHSPLVPSSLVARVSLLSLELAALPESLARQSRSVLPIAPRLSWPYPPDLACESKAPRARLQRSDPKRKRPAIRGAIDSARFAFAELDLAAAQRPSAPVHALEVLVEAPMEAELSMVRPSVRQGNLQPLERKAEAQESTLELPRLQHPQLQTDTASSSPRAHLPSPE